MRTSIYLFFVGGGEASAVFGRGDAIAALKLLAQVWSGEAHLASHISNSHLRMVGQQVVSHLHADSVDVLWEGHATGVGIEQVVQMMTANVETVADVLTHQTDLSVEVLVADSRVDGFEEVLVHFVFVSAANLGKNERNRKKTYARIWDMAQMRASETAFFVNIESVLEIPVVSIIHIPTIFDGGDTIFPFELFTQVGGR